MRLSWVQHFQPIIVTTLKVLVMNSGTIVDIVVNEGIDHMNVQERSNVASDHGGAERVESWRSVAAMRIGLVCAVTKLCVR